MSDLLNIRATVRLVAFAVEAERVLRDIEFGAEHDAELSKRLGNWCEARLQWVEYAGTAPEVLEGICRQLDVLIDAEIRDTCHGGVEP